MKRTLNYFLILTAVVAVAVSCNDSDDGANDDSAVLGTWRIIEVKISDQALTQRSPNDEIITITFENGGSYEGSTSANTFSGRYEVNGATLTLLEFETTEAADTAFAGVFYGAIEEAIVPSSTQAQFGFSFDSRDMILVFGSQGEMLLEAQ
jgi:hypothetical protein